MRSRVLSGIALAAVVALALAACTASGQQSASTGSSATTAGATPYASTAANATPQNSMTASAGMQDVAISITGTTITPGTMTFMSGTHYRFTVTNHDTTARQCLIGPQSIAGMSMQQRQTHAMAATATIAPGKQQTFVYIFPMSAEQQQLTFACYNSAGHAQMMRVTVTR